MADIEKISIEIEAIDSASKAFKDIQQNLSSLQEAMNKVADAFTSIEKEPKKFVEGLEDASKQTKKLNKVISETLKKIPTSINNGFGNLKTKFSDFFKNLNKSMILRMSKLMLLRQAIRAIFSAMKEGIDNYYQYAKATRQLDTSTAGVLDKLKNLGTSLVNNLGVAFSNILATLYPIIEKILFAIDSLVVKINMLFAALSGKKSIDKATTGMYQYAAATKAAKNALAGFDELNNLNTSSSSGSGVSASQMFEPIEIPEEFIDSAAKIKEFFEPLKDYIFNPLTLSGLGILFVATGHLLLGLGCIVSAGVLAGKEIQDNGHILPQTVRDGLKLLSENVLTTFGLLGIGAVLLLTGHWLLGLGCIIGAGALGMNQLSENGSYLTERVQTQLRIITGIVSSFMVAIGLLLCISGANIPLGLGMLAIGCIGFAASLPLKDTTYQNIRNTMTKIGTVLGGCLLALGAILCLTGVAIPLGLGMMALGGVSLATSIAPNWNYFLDKVKELMRKIKEAIKLPHFSISGSFSILPPSVPKLKVDWYANGGFPNAGDLFMANEAGAELVGSMNGRTTVANQMEIIEGIKQGVIEAMQYSNGSVDGTNELLKQLINVVDNKSMNAYIDGDSIGRASVKYINKQSRLMGGSLI